MHLYPQYLFSRNWSSLLWSWWFHSGWLWNHHNCLAHHRFILFSVKACQKYYHLTYKIFLPLHTRHNSMYIVQQNFGWILAFWKCQIFSQTFCTPGRWVLCVAAAADDFDNFSLTIDIFFFLQTAGKYNDLISRNSFWNTDVIWENPF